MTVFVMNLVDWSGFYVQWLSPHTQARRHGVRGRPCIRAFPISSVMATLGKLAGSRAFYRLPLTTLRALAKYFRCDVSGLSRFGTLLCLIRFCLPGLSEEQIMEILGLRCDDPLEAICSAELEECEGAVDVLDRDERNALKGSKERHRSSKEERRQFAREYSKRKAHLKALAVAKAKAKAKAKTGAKAKAKLTVPNNVFPAVVISQAEAKRFLPPGAYIWRSWGQRCWIGRCPPLGSHSRTWLQYGQLRAARIVVKRCWADYLAMNGLPMTDCPIIGMF